MLHRQMRKLSIDDPEDRWFVSMVDPSYLTKPSAQRYDYMQLPRLLSPGTLRYLEDEQIGTSEEMILMKKELPGNIFDMVLESTYPGKEDE